MIYIATALTFIVLALTQLALMRVQLIVPENTPASTPRSSTG